MAHVLFLSALLLAAWPAMAAEDLGDAARGAEIFHLCSGCHQIGPDAENAVGPVLNEVFGRRAASVPGFPYSNAFQRAGEKGLEWHADTLNDFLENPRQIVSASRMSFEGLPDAQDRADLIAFLRDYSANPQDIPGADPTARAVGLGIDPAILAIEGDAEYGEYLSGECMTCHQASGGDAGIPSIVLWPEADFVLALQAYKQGKRVHPVMQMIAARLGDEEIAALAAYFGAIGRE